MPTRKNQSWLTVLTLILCAILILVLWLSLPLWVYRNFPGDYGIVGDVFGTVNALFSALALIGVGVAVYLQYTDLQEAREALLAAKGDAEQETFDRRFSEILRFLRHELVEFEITVDKGLTLTATGARKNLTTYNGEAAFRVLKMKLLEMPELDNPARHEEARNIFNDVRRRYGAQYAAAVELACVALKMFNSSQWSRYHSNLFVALCGREFRGFVRGLITAEETLGVSRGEEVLNGLFASGFSEFVVQSKTNSESNSESNEASES